MSHTDSLCCDNCGEKKQIATVESGKMLCMDCFLRLIMMGALPKKTEAA